MSKLLPKILSTIEPYKLTPKKLRALFFLLNYDRGIYQSQMAKLLVVNEGNLCRRLQELELHKLITREYKSGGNWIRLNPRIKPAICSLKRWSHNIQKGVWVSVHHLKGQIHLKDGVRNKISFINYYKELGFRFGCLDKHMRNKVFSVFNDDYQLIFREGSNVLEFTLNEILIFYKIYDAVEIQKPLLHYIVESVNGIVSTLHTHYRGSLSVNLINLEKVHVATILTVPKQRVLDIEKIESVIDDSYIDYSNSPSMDIELNLGPFEIVDGANQIIEEVLSQLEQFFSSKYGHFLWGD